MHNACCPYLSTCVAVVAQSRRNGANERGVSTGARSVSPRRQHRFWRTEQRRRQEVRRGGVVPRAGRVPRVGLRLQLHRLPSAGYGHALWGEEGAVQRIPSVRCPFLFCDLSGLFCFPFLPVRSPRVLMCFFIYVLREISVTRCTCTCSTPRCALRYVPARPNMWHFTLRVQHRLIVLLFFCLFGLCLSLLLCCVVLCAYFSV